MSRYNQKEKNYKINVLAGVFSFSFPLTRSFLSTFVETSQA